MKHTTPGYSGGETLGGGDASLPDASILNFWQWAYSDLTDNVNRGVFAEWMVAKLLGLNYTECRPPWQAWDITTPEGVRLEVKAASYVQAWTQQHLTADDLEKPARIQFSNLRMRLFLDPAQTLLSEEPTYNADLYVFCMQTNADIATWDALDLRQWEYFLLTKEALEAHGYKSISLNTLRTLSGGSLTAQQFVDVAAERIAELATTPGVKNRAGSSEEAKP